MNYSIESLNQNSYFLDFQKLKLKLWQGVENYLSIRGIRYYVIAFQKEEIYLVEKKMQTSLVVTTVKIASYITGILPFLALSMRTILRCSHRFHMIKDNKSIAVPASLGSQENKKTVFINKNKQNKKRDDEISIEKKTLKTIPKLPLFTSPFNLQKALKNSLEEEKTSCEEISLKPDDYEKFLEKCPLTDELGADSIELKNRYEMYKEMRGYKKVLFEKYGTDLFTKGLNRQWNVIELSLTLRPFPFFNHEKKDEDWLDLESICELYKELSSQNYLVEETLLVLHTLFSVYTSHPQVEHIKTHFEMKSLVKKVDEVAYKLDIIKFSEEQTRRSLWFVPQSEEGPNNGYIAKYVEGINLNELDAFAISQLLGNSTIPLITKISLDEERKSLKAAGIIQVFFNQNVDRIFDFLKTNPNAAKILQAISNSYLQLYLLQTFMLCQTDGHMENTFIQFDETNQFKELIDFDNEMILPFTNYLKWGNSEGKASASIALLGLKQARVPLSRAMLLLFSLPLLERKICSYFKKRPGLPLSNPSLNSLKERLERIRKICRFAKDKSLSMSCERIFFEIFTHQDFLFFQRQNQIPDVISFTMMNKIQSNQIMTLKNLEKLLKGKENKNINLLWTNLQELGCAKNEGPNLRKKGCAGEIEIEQVRMFLTSLPPSVDCEFKAMELHQEEIEMNLWEQYEEKEAIDPSLISLFLKGTPAILARRIHREFPQVPLFIQKREEEQYALIVSLDPIMKETFTTYKKIFESICNWQQNHDNKIDMRIPITQEIFDSFTKSQKNFKVSYKSVLTLQSFYDFCKDEKFVYLILWTLNAIKESCIKVSKESNEYFMHIYVA